MPIMELHATNICILILRYYVIILYYKPIHACFTVGKVILTQKLITEI